MRLLTICSAVSLLLAIPLLAQQGDSTFKLNVNVDLVELHVTVMDDKDRTVGGLTKDNFKIFENRMEQPISVFKHEDVPVSLGLVLDNSRSIQPRKQRLDAAALSFVRKSNPEDETFVVHFDSEVVLSRDFTANERELEETLAAAKPFGETAIYDALHRALDTMERAKYDKKALLLVTDGIDNKSKRTFAETIERLKRSDVAVFVVGLLSQSGGLEAEETLIRLAEASGGRAYFPDDVIRAHAMMDRIARDLREQYTLGYFSTNVNRDGSWRSVRVEIKPPVGFPPNLTASYRHGYYSPGN